ncbi:MAG: radical SAM protein [Clostridia bacterium]|nr:radical SAM protein [Clostridia bacterium]
MNTPVYSGIITNYVCTAACRHCMFASSPDCPKEFITVDRAEELAALLEKAGTASVHIGGGEPFMNFGALCDTVKVLHRHGIGIDYIETNGFWAGKEDFIRERLHTLKELGVDCIMVSVDPFHIEYVSLERVLRLCNLLEEEGFDYFIWQQRFLKKLLKLDLAKVHTKAELEALLGKHYITDTAREYGLGMNGRALAIAAEIYDRKPVEAFLDGESCRKILRPQHCHFDLYGNAVPSGCPGLAAEANDYLTENISAKKYPVFDKLIHGGVAALYAYATEKGFTPDPAGYPTKCALCYGIRQWLLVHAPSADLAPACFYENMEKTLGNPSGENI